MLSAVIGTVVFGTALAVQVVLVGQGVIPSNDHPMAEGVGRIPWQLIGSIAVVVAALAGIAAWAVVARRQRKKGN